MSQLHLYLASVPQSVPKAVRFVEANALREDLPKELIDRLMLATSEAVANGIVHGNRYDATKHVHMRWQPEDDGIWLHVEDEGRGPKSARVDAPSLPDDMMQTSGRGLYIIQMLAEQVEVEGSRVSMLFKPRADHPH